MVLGCYVDDRYRDFMAECGYDTSSVKDGDPIFIGHETRDTLERSRHRFKNKFAHQNPLRKKGSGR